MLQQKQRLKQQQEASNTPIDLSETDLAREKLRLGLSAAVGINLPGPSGPAQGLSRIQTGPGFHAGSSTGGSGSGPLLQKIWPQARSLDQSNGMMTFLSLCTFFVMSSLLYGKCTY